MAKNAPKNATHTPGPWAYACDSYGKVQHSKKACVYSKPLINKGDPKHQIAAQIENWEDARLIAAAPDLLAACEALLKAWQGLDAHTLAIAAPAVEAAIAKARGES